MNFRVVRVKPDTPAFMDEVAINDNNRLSIINMPSSYLIGAELSKNNFGMKFIELDPNVYIVCLNPYFFTCDERDKKLNEINDKNRTIQDITIYGDFIIIQCFNDKFVSLSIEQVDKYIEMFK